MMVTDPPKKPIHQRFDIILNLEKWALWVCLFLVYLIPFSKISFKVLKIIPSDLSPFIFQYGIHPYINFAAQGLAFPLLFHVWLHSRNTGHFSPYYRSFIFFLMALLSLQTFLQITLVHIDQPFMMQMAGLGMGLLLIIIYGLFIPGILGPKLFWRHLTISCGTLVILSIVLFPIFGSNMYRGGRFIGLFKHIPHMVSASTFAFIGLFPQIFDDQSIKWKKKIVLIILWTLIGLVVFMTATKAAIITICIATCIGVWKLESRIKAIKLFRFAFSFLLILGLFTLGPMAGKVMVEVATGQRQLGDRPAQDGVSERIKEITRGWSYFKENPWIGKGLMFKFMNTDGVELSHYNSYKDPHNFFVSAAVIGGRPLLCFSLIAYLMMILVTIKSLIKKEPHQLTSTIFLVAHLPVFLIYHQHFSLGGIGDRVYWSIFGLLALSQGPLFKQETF